MLTEIERKWLKFSTVDSKELHDVFSFLRKVTDSAACKLLLFDVERDMLDDRVTKNIMSRNKVSEAESRFSAQFIETWVRVKNKSINETESVIADLEKERKETLEKLKR